ncbi:hypothetical protein BBW65_01075 [Helicobacter enhydrae]|uniref:Outer membrane protein beta-barrel domain-containing protein n=1 Tax=Helicobacter enhydrae TaxID=222136 RepID=A0A1B1U402_9HELI|nr:hypothetical protein [Helicobacter enhydrae]ANV97490.1 hypothetical protein BBW65_01075 [Helicobacter enhydrae]
MKKTILCLLLMFFISRAENRPYLMMFTSNFLQLASFHIGTDTSLQTSDSKTSLVLGGSIGWNYILDWNRAPATSNIFGLRLKYLYSFDLLQTQSMGGIFYWHTPIFDENFFPFAFALGGGILFDTKDKFQTIGGYAETGITLWKIIPINVDILYRINIYRFRNTSNDISHHLNVVFTFF